MKMTIAYEPPFQDLTQLSGIGPTTAKNLETIGYGTIEALATVTKQELIEVPGIGDKVAESIIQKVQQILDLNWRTSRQELENAIQKILRKNKTVNEIAFVLIGHDLNIDYFSSIYIAVKEEELKRNTESIEKNYYPI